MGNSSHSVLFFLLVLISKNPRRPREGGDPAHWVRCALKARWIPPCAGKTKFKMGMAETCG
ncbi:hypothetical protein AYO29_07405 [Coxiella burnetii str. Schperling]|nr:hypothetical protein AYO29_07405 [Coxiella burnetii str. Schperling]